MNCVASRLNLHGMSTFSGVRVTNRGTLKTLIFQSAKMLLHIFSYYSFVFNRVKQNNVKPVKSQPIYSEIFIIPTKGKLYKSFC